MISAPLRSSSDSRRVGASMPVAAGPAGVTCANSGTARPINPIAKAKNLIEHSFVTITRLADHSCDTLRFSRFRPRQHHETVGKVRAKQPLPGFEATARRLHPIALEEFQPGALEELTERRRVLPVGVIFMDHRPAVAPNFPGLPLIKRVGRRDDQRATWL